MSRYDDQRLVDIAAAIAAIREHLTHGDTSNGLVFDDVRVRLIEIGEAVKTISAELLATEPEIPWRRVAAMRDQLAHRHFDTSHAVVTETVDRELPELEQAVGRLAVRCNSKVPQNQRTDAAALRRVESATGVTGSPAGLRAN